jgi:sulfur-oxidizing protein SoxZ
MATSSDSIRMKVDLKNGIAEVKAIITHPSESGFRKEGDTIVPAHYIQEFECFLNDDSVLKSYWGGGIQKNPYISFRIRDGKKGDRVRLTWRDNKDQSDFHEVVIQ